MKRTAMLLFLVLIPIGVKAQTAAFVERVRAANQLLQEETWWRTDAAPLPAATYLAGRYEDLMFFSGDTVALRKSDSSDLRLLESQIYNDSIWIEDAQRRGDVDFAARCARFKAMTEHTLHERAIKFAADYAAEPPTK